MFQSNGLIDDFVVYGAPSDYLEFARAVQTAILGEGVVTLRTSSGFVIEIAVVTFRDALFTSLQNQDDEYLSTDDWDKRDILRIQGSTTVLEQLHLFLKDLSGRGVGYSYLAEYSDELSYCDSSPEWRLHVTDPIYSVPATLN
ncbi:hypothetical protein [Ahniella affigens]|nr:hypothetical protein [Ahniella affigens]